MSEIALDKVLEAYRDMFGVKTELANEIHRDACIEVARLRDEEGRKDAAIEDLLTDVALAKETLVESVRPFVQEFIGVASSARFVLRDVDATITTLKAALEKKGGE